MGGRYSEFSRFSMREVQCRSVLVGREDLLTKPL